MARYIDAEYVLECMKHYIEDIGYEERINKRYSKITVEDAMALVEDAPTADVRPERYGEWLYSEDGIWECSECGGGSRSPTNPFCWKCGAKMDGGEESG